jgi:hypothetical protein
VKVFVDGRSDFYGAQFDQKFLDVMNVKWNWETTLAKHRVHTVLLPVDAPPASALKLSAHWRVVYDDGVAIVFRSTATTTQTAGAVAEGSQVTAVQNGGFSAIARSRTPKPVIERSQSYARR